MDGAEVDVGSKEVPSISCYILHALLMLSSSTGLLPTLNQVDRDHVGPSDNVRCGVSVLMDLAVIWSFISHTDSPQTSVELLLSVSLHTVIFALRPTDIFRSALGLRLGSLVGERVQPDLDETANERVGALRIQSLLHLAGMVSRDHHHLTCIGSGTCIISLCAHGVLTRDARGKFGSRRLRVGESLTS